VNAGPTRRKADETTALLLGHTRRTEPCATGCTASRPSSHRPGGQAGVGPDTATTLLITADDNPGRLGHEKSFAALVGASSIPVNSGQIQGRVGLNRGGDRDANSALWRIAILRIATDQDTRHYVAKRQSEGKTKSEAIRCLKRYIAREVFNALPEPAIA
jgi:transposase